MPACLGCCVDSDVSSCSAAALQTGYLSMDQARSLLPLEATDANVSLCADTVGLQNWEQAVAQQKGGRLHEPGTKKLVPQTGQLGSGGTGLGGTGG